MASTSSCHWTAIRTHKPHPDSNALTTRPHRLQFCFNLWLQCTWKPNAITAWTRFEPSTSRFPASPFPCHSLAAIHSMRGQGHNLQWRMACCCRPESVGHVGTPPFPCHAMATIRYMRGQSQLCSLRWRMACCCKPESVGRVAYASMSLTGCSTLHARPKV